MCVMVVFAAHRLPTPFPSPMKVALEGSSYFKLPRIFQWFTGNIGLHHIHHVHSNIPNYNLQQCHDEIPAFQVVKAITLGTSLRSLQLGLCDEKSKKLVSFRSLTALGGGRSEHDLMFRFLFR